MSTGGMVFQNHRTTQRTGMAFQRCEKVDRFAFMQRFCMRFCDSSFSSENTSIKPCILTRHLLKQVSTLVTQVLSNASSSINGQVIAFKVFLLPSSPSAFTTIVGSGHTGVDRPSNGKGQHNELLIVDHALYASINSIMVADYCKGLYITNKPVSSSGSSSAWGMIESFFLASW